MEIFYQYDIDLENNNNDINFENLLKKTLVLIIVLYTYFH